MEAKEILKGKIIVIGITGGIAAYKVCSLTSSLTKSGADVHIIMTKNAQNFITPLTMQTLSRNKVITEMFDTSFEWDIKHISLAQQADIFVIAPATANILAKAANGLSDDFLSTTLLSTEAPILACPAMNTKMLVNAATKHNILTLEQRGYNFLYGNEGMLACGEVGSGRMAEPEQIEQEIVKLLNKKKDFNNRTILITAGATQEDIDGVRCITNYSSGKMGVALARAAIQRGAKVIFIRGKMSVPSDIEAKTIDVTSTEQMHKAVMENYIDSDIIIMAAAPSDYKVTNKSSQKIKEPQLTLEFEKNPDIAADLGKIKGGRILVIFAAETENTLINAKNKLKNKNADIAVANNVSLEGAGFNSDTNIASIIIGDKIINLDKMSKTDLADIILDTILKISKQAGNL